MFHEAFFQIAFECDLGLLWSKVLNSDAVHSTGWRLSLLLYKVSESVLFLEFSDFLDLNRIVEDHVRKAIIVVLCDVLIFDARFVA